MAKKFSMIFKKDTEIEFIYQDNINIDVKVFWTEPKIQVDMSVIRNFKKKQ